MKAHRAPLRVAILGFGNVGSSVARLLLAAAGGELRLTHIFNRAVARKRADWVPAGVIWTESIEDVLHSEADVVVELAGGLNPAGAWVRQALAAGKSVVTANKKLIAAEGVELEALAAAKGAHLLYGAAVAGGVPVIPGLTQGLAGDALYRIEGILNGTCNFILSSMERGADFGPTLAEAQRLGYAEADPTEDVDGFDARAKLAILARLALCAMAPVEKIACRSIRPLTAVDFTYAHELGATIRQVARAEIVPDGKLLALASPMLVPSNSPLAWSRGTENMVVVSGRYGGDVVFSGHGAGGNPTAVAVVSDLLGIAHGSRPVGLGSSPVAVSSDLLLRHYIRLVVRDRPGIVAAVAGALARQGINIDAILQKPGYPVDALPFVVTVEPCVCSALQAALVEAAAFDFMAAPPLDLPIL